MCSHVQVLEELVSKLLVQMPLLLRLLDHIALLDMLVAFFQAVTGGCAGGPALCVTPSAHG
jgi:predicted membrane-bound dolichyl-phosphate-mannose-protein mannosyltransferase